MKPLYRDQCLAFQIEKQDIKGRIIRLDKPLNDLFKSLDYADYVKKELGQAMALTAMLGSLMKFEGILTLQIKTDGLIRGLVSDFSTDGNGSGVVRGYVGLEEDLPANTPVLGKGQMMVTMDQGKYMARYQGIVKLEQNSLKKSAQEYFLTSEQLPTCLMITCDKNHQGDWTAAAIMIQHLARNSKESPLTEAEEKDHWNTATILLSSVKKEELLDKTLSYQDLLIRLYHESGVRLFTATEINGGCRCSDEKLRQVLANFHTKELEDMAKDGVITMTCEFCHTAHKFALKKLIN